MARKAQLFLSSITVLIVTIPMLQGCQAEEVGDVEPPALGAIGTQYLDYLATLDEVDRFYCGCEIEAGDFKSIEECLAYFGGPAVPPLLAECYARTLDEYEQARSSVECQAERFETLLGCLATAGCGGDLSACEQQVYAETCPNRPYEVDAALAEECLGYSLPAPFQCADGTKISPWLECDFASDCPDGSDEYADCPGTYTCQSGEVISQLWLCDGIVDCGAGDDEAECPKP